jgi:hypothetical protein
MNTSTHPTLNDLNTPSQTQGALFYILEPNIIQVNLLNIMTATE